MDYKEAMEYINKVQWSGSRPGLSRIGELLGRLGNPQKKLRYVHIAGTNGKGSCAAMTASVLKSAGYKTGLFISPYLYYFNERMQINGKPIEDDALTDIVGRIKEQADRMEDQPTIFELMTAAALLWFAEQKCDIAVLEVGMGGRFDATNIIECPEAAVIMNIGLDHTEVLGDTLEKIAFEKAGIIKKGCSCVLYQQTPGVENVIRERCREENAELRIADFSKLEKEFDSLYGQTFRYKGNAYALPLLGAHQLKNAAAAIETAEVLREKGWKINQDALEHGIYAVSWPGRFEIVKDDPYFVVDGGHNPQCAETVAANIRSYFPDMYHVILIGVLADKDYAGLTEILNAEADEYICVTPDSPRALPAEELSEFLKKYGRPVRACKTIEDGVGAALDAAAEKNGMACAVGSLYMAGRVRACFNLF